MRDISFLDETNNMLAEAAYGFVGEHIKPYASQIDKDNLFPKDLWKKLGKQGLLGVTAPEEYGGAGLGYLSHTIIMQAISYGSASIGLSYAAHSNLCINQINLHATAKQKSAYLPKLITGEHVGALAISEAASGSDALSLQLDAKKTNGGYIINGNKMWITNGPEADVIVTYAKTDKAAKHKGITAFIVSSDMSGLTKMDKLDKLGMRGSNTCELVFKDVFVPDENILGKVNEGIKALMCGLDYERVVLAAGPLGIMESALDFVIPYIKERSQFGSPIGQFQLIQGKIADMYTAYQATKAYLHSTASICDRGGISRKRAASVILMAAENATKIALDAIQIYGGNGYTNEYEVSRLLRDAKLYEIGAGTSEIRRIIIGRDIFEDK
ncbi:MAG: isovaleryl-CoA dehydrogenase [Legionellales bacterium]|jgi:isovaleryl-CoA dehydrogenase|nr:isovaleryl-CoA dehydrogenase [Legionellales bacterium]